MALDFSKFGTPVEQSSALDFAKFGTPVQPPPEKESAFRQVADVPLGIAKGAVQGVRMIADAFGAGTDTSKTIKSAETYLADLMSAQAKNDQQEISRIMKDAEDKGVLDQVKAAVKAFSIAPVDTLSSALGTAAPVIVGALGAKVLGAGALVSTGVSALTGAGMGAGTIKGSIYEETKSELKKAGASEEDAEAKAQLAQQYNGKNLDQILLGTVLGGAAAVGPLEKGGAAFLARKILGKTGAEATETVAEQAAKGAIRRRAEAGVLEAIPEAVQAGQEKVAQNIALQREGFDVPTFRGAAGAATLEAIAGGGLGATLGGGKPEVAKAPEPPAPRTGPLTTEEQAELDRQRAAAERPKTTEELLAGIQTGKPTTAEDIARIKDEHETAVIEGLLAQDAEMKQANDWIAAEMERVNQLDELRNQARDEEERQAIERRILDLGIKDVDQRVRETRILSRVQDLIDRNIPYASTAINDINQKFGVINEAPLTEDERARVENIMGMVNTFTNFVNLPVLAPKPVDQFAENQAMEALIKERTERGQAEPLRTAPVAPSPRIEEAPISQGVSEGTTLRPTSGVEPSVTEDRQLVTPAPVAPALPVEPAPVVEAAAPTAPVAEVPASRSSEAWRTEGKTPQELMADKVESVSVELAMQIAEEASAKDFTPTELPTAIQQWASDSKVPADDLRASVIKALDKFDISEARKSQVRKALSPLRAAAPKAEVPVLETAAPRVVEAATRPVEERVVTEKEPSTRKEAQAFGKAIGAAQPYPGELRGRVNLPAQKAAKEGNFQGVLSALENSKNVIVAEIAKRARTLGTKIVIDDNAEETYTGPSPIMRQMSIDGAKMHLEALNKIRALAPQVDAMADGAPLGYDYRAERIKAIDQGKDAGSMSLADIAKMGHSMFAPLATGPINLRTKEDFKALQKAYEDLTSEYGESALQLTSTGSAEMRGVAGAYDADTDTIRVPEYTAKREEVLSHEIVHAQTVQAVANPTLRQKPIVARLNKLYEHVKKELEGRPGRAPYGIQSIQEFIAEGMGNPAFQFLLKKIKYENTSAWNSFVQTIADLIGVKRDTAFTELLSIYSDLTTEQKAVPKLEAPAVEAPTQDRKSLGSAQAQQSNFEQTLRTLLNKFGLKDVGLSIIEGMQDAGSYAQQLIRIADRAGNPIRTLRHEAIHALRELGFFTDAQWKSLSKMAKDKWIDQYLKQRNVDGKPLKAGEESRYDAYMREYNGDMEKITEEAVADAFADFDATQPPSGMLQALLNRMKDLFQSIKSALTKVESPEQIFGKVEKGELRAGAKAAAKSLRDKATANFLRWFGDSKVVDMIGEPLVVYHGSKSDITEFDPNKGAAGNQGMFFTTDIDLANVYGKDGAVYPVYVSIKNPLILQGNERFAPQGIKGKLAKLLFPAKYTKAEREQRIKDMLFDGNAGRIFSKQDVELLRREGYDGVVTMNAYPEGSNLQVIVAFNPTQIKSAIGNNGDYSLTNADIRKSIGGVSPGQQALETINRMGMGVKPPEPGKVAKLQQILKDAGENPAGTKASAKAALTKWLDAFETMAFSGDAAFNNKVTSSVINDMKENEEVLGKLLELSQSQAVNADNVVSRGLIEGSIEYNEEMKKYQSVKKDENFAALIGKLEELSTKYGTSPQEMERIAHAYLVAKRLPGIIKRNEELDTEIAAEEATAKPDRKSIDKWKSLKVYVSPEQEAMVDDGISLGKTIPELSQISDMWNSIRKNNIAVMVESGLYTPEYAQQLWDNMDYVPYYREEQLEADAGPTEFIRGLQVKAKEFQLKGSGAAVNDVFENMMLWSQYAMNRAIRADKARRMIDVAKDIDIGDRKMAVQVKEEKRGMNIVRVFRDGKQEMWDLADPMFVPAFSAIQNVSIPMFKWAAKVADVLRNSVVLYPMFSVAQVPQDSFAAMFTSGLKPQHALKIPILAVKEFIKTLNKTSATHNELVKYGVVGARNFSAEVMRQDAEIFAGLKPPKGGWNKTKDFLEHIAMSADNAVRQAVYEAARQQGVSKAEALEKAFEIFNVRRRGTSKALNLAGQTIPFFYAYLAAQRVAYRTITGIGTSPTERKAALQTLASTSAAVFTLSMLYAMMVADDEDYAETPAAVRDRTLTIPGTGGVRIPLRADFFLFPKMVAEHTYLMITDQGYEDGAKFRRSMRDGLINAISSPTPLPQIAKPALEVLINYSFFDGKPVIGTFEKQKDMERQFNDSTSEFSKLLGKTGLVSPIAADHLIRGMLGSAGGLALYGTNMFLHSDPDVPRPEMSVKEMLAALPGTSGFLKRPQESALKNDFFVLRDEVEKAVNTFNDIKTRSPQGIEDFLADEKKMARLMLGKPVDKINRELSKIRKVITQITNMPENQMSADDKSDNIRQLRELEREILKSVDVKELREMAKI